MTNPSDLYPLSLDDAEMAPERALLLGRMIGRSFKNVSIGMDSNPSSTMIKNSLMTGLLSAGAHIKDLGVIPTPAMVLSSSSGCMIAVGEPNEQGVLSGIRLMYPDGSMFTLDQIKQIIRAADGDRRLPGYKDVGILHHSDSAIRNYIDAMIKRHASCNESPVILDCGCGCTSLCTPQILASLGADLVTIDAQPDMKYCSRPPGIEEADLSILSGMVKGNVGNIGIALNGDGTRLALIDESGNYVRPDRVLSLILLYLKPTSLVIPVNMSSVVNDALNDLIGDGISTPYKAHSERVVIRTDNDLDSIIAAMKENNAEIGALGNGTIIYSDVGMCPDAINTAAILSKMAGENSIKNLLGSFPKYLVLNDSVRLSGNPDLFGRKLSEKLSELDTEEIWQIDGWRVEMTNGWFTVSSNNKDPGRIDITAESKDRAYAVSMMELAKDIVRECI